MVFYRVLFHTETTYPGALKCASPVWGPHVASTLLSHQRTPVSAESGRAARTNGPLLDWIIISGRQVLRLPAYREVEYSPQQSQRGEAAFVFSEKLRVDRLRIFPHRAAAKVLELSCLLPCRVQDS